MATRVADSRNSPTAFAAWDWLSDRLGSHALRRLPGDHFLGDSLSFFDRASVRSAPDGYPIVEGTIGQRCLKLSSIPDTLELKRLPQLWLSVVLRSDHAHAPMVLTARPRGDEYISLRQRVAAPLAVPDWLPRDFEIRGDGDVPALLDKLRRPLGVLFADPNVKEFATTKDRLHLLYRLSEGRRGSHLLLRKAVFDDVLTPEKLRGLFASLLTLEGSRS